MLGLQNSHLKISLYTGLLLLSAISIGTLEYGWNFWAGFEIQNVIMALLCLPVFGTLIWLRWDWAPEQRKKHRDQKSK